MIFTFEFFYICTNFGENRSTNATVRDGQMHRCKLVLKSVPCYIL